MEKIKLEKVNFTYPEGSKKALEDISFSVNEGEFCLVSGASAAGKSTLMKLLKAEIAPKGELSGEIRVNGIAGYVSQNVSESIVCDRVRSELSFGLTGEGMSSGEAELLVAETASYFNLESKLDSEISKLSGGEKQMVNLAAVMITKPDILILDEPCSQLDPVSAERFMNTVKRLHRDFKTTVIISEHSSEEVYYLADSVLLLEGGRLLIKDAPQCVLDFCKSTENKMLCSFPLKMRLASFEAKPAENGEKMPKTDLEAKGVFFAYEKGEGVLGGLDLSVFENKINAVIGPNSSGKTTLLKVIAGVYKPLGGKVKTKKSVSMLPQNVFDLFTKDTCEEEIAFGEITSFLEIDEIKKQHPFDLSGGQAQRLALAKVLETGADIILLDEPTKGLDAVLKIKLGELLGDLCKKGKTIVIVTHDTDFAGEYADYVSFLSKGRIITTSGRREFFSRLNFYTTEISKLSAGKCAGLRDIL
ncbi:MAG: ATP-binding cassette domain-containing protein [Eubacterium sp.]|nr:ATP-binding cassette domain-containing protein [Eubacterium sp.]